MISGSNDSQKSPTTGNEFRRQWNRRGGGLLQQIKTSFRRAKERNQTKSSHRSKPFAETGSNLSSAESDETFRSFYDTPSSKFISAYFVDHPRKLWCKSVLGFVLFLLFGPALRDIVFPKRSDLVFDIFLFITFVVLLIDIIFQCMANPRYFHFRFPCTRKKGFSVGSTMFWLDLLGTVWVFFEISLVNTRQLGMNEIILDDAAIKVSLSNLRFLRSYPCIFYQIYSHSYIYSQK